MRTLRLGFSVIIVAGIMFSASGDIALRCGAMLETHSGEVLRGAVVLVSRSMMLFRFTLISRGWPE